METRRVAALLVVVGLAVLAHPVYLFANHGQASAFVHQIDEVQGEPITDDAVAYADLPPRARRSIDAALNGESSTLWRGDHDAAIEALRDAEYVEREGTYYRYYLAYHGGLLTGIETAARVFLTGVGSLALVAGASVARTGRLVPLSPRRALAVPVVAAVAVAATNVYDVALSGASAAYLLPAEAFGPIALFGVAAGAALRRDDWRALGATVGLGVVASLAAFAGGANPIAAGIVGAPILGPAVLFGFLLTAPRSRVASVEEAPASA
ncbi:hypothetical protein [Halorussus marinus]|uniref:hypothetical protein n=1 Tax=Halorussus marinus TaxID=2505976 RepID=UPI00106E3F11|nr:hypothetical protein [Halorussus marinus]